MADKFLDRKVEWNWEQVSRAEVVDLLTLCLRTAGAWEHNSRRASGTMSVCELRAPVRLRA